MSTHETIAIGRLALGLVVLASPVASHAHQSHQPGGAQPNRWIGTWQGTLAAGQGIRLALTIRQDSGGALIGLMRTANQAGVEALAMVDVRGDTLRFTIAGQHISYVGVLTSSGDSLRGTFTQGMSLPLTLTHAASATASTQAKTRPQDPRAPFPYRTEDVSIPSVEGVRLAGTVIIPQGTGPFPAVVFVTGSGAQDRDEAFLGHRPFLVIADYLARHGIASLRYDDRGYAKSTGDFAAATSADFANDAEAAVRFLSGVPGVARGRVGIIGHSEGGLIGPMVSARTRAVAFLVLLAGPGLRGDALTPLQLRRMAAASGEPSTMTDRSVATNVRLLRAVVESKDSADAVARLTAIRDQIVAQLPEAQRSMAAARFDQAVPRLTAPWMRYFLSYDPRLALGKVRVPVLALNGALDAQVPATENLAAIDTALKRAGNRDYRVVELPGLNHLLQTAVTGAPSEYATIDETIAPQVLELVASWINERFAHR